MPDWPPAMMAWTRFGSVPKVGGSSAASMTASRPLVPAPKRKHRPPARNVPANASAARTISRRAERLMVALAARPNEPVGGSALRYINRLSDFLFVAARYANDKGQSDVLWVPGQNR